MVYEYTFKNHQLRNYQQLKVDPCKTKFPSERRKELKRKFEEENKKRAERVKEIEKQVEKFAMGTDKEFNFEPVEKEWRAIQWVLFEFWKS